MDIRHVLPMTVENWIAWFTFCQIGSLFARRHVATHEKPSGAMQNHLGQSHSSFTLCPAKRRSQARLPEDRENQSTTNTVNIESISGNVTENE